MVVITQATLIMHAQCDRVNWYSMKDDMLALFNQMYLNVRIM